MRPFSPLACCFVIVGGLGVVHGIFSDRWGPSQRLESSVEALTRIPSSFGDWTGEDIPFDPTDMAHAGIEGRLVRRYGNARTRESVSLLIVCGRGGPICVHTPDVCYAGNGYSQAGEEKMALISTSGGGSDSFRVIRFKKMDSVTPSQLEIYWSWSRDGGLWEAPENPRLSLARSASLYKMYVVREFAPGSRSENVDSCRAFLDRALPEISQKLHDEDPRNSTKK